MLDEPRSPGVKWGLAEPLERVGGLPVHTNARLMPSCRPQACDRPVRRQSAVDRLQLEVVLDPEASPFAPDARTLEAAMRGRSLDGGPVDDDASRPDS